VPYTALLDANVLVPYTVTDVLLRLAEAGFYRVLWSSEILDETVRTLLRVHPDIPASTLRSRVVRMGDFFPDATVTGWEPLLDVIVVPDAGDRHVVAAAIVGGADTIVTANLADFPAAVLDSFDLVAVHPDDFLLDQWDLDPTLTDQVLQEIVEDRNRPSVTRAEVLAQLERGGCPRFAACARAGGPT